MVLSCSAYGCTQRFERGGVSFFRFPTEQIRMNRWLCAIKRKNFYPTRSSRICGKHFRTGKVNHDPEHPDFVPSIFCFSERPKKRKKWTRRIHPQKNREPNTPTIPDPPQSTSTDEINPSSSGYCVSGMEDCDPYLMLDVSSWPSKTTQSTVPIIFLRRPPASDVDSSGIHQTYNNSTDQIQPYELSDASLQYADQMQPVELSDDSDPVNYAEATLESCDECEQLKALVEKMRIKIAGLEIERKFYKEKSILLEESIEECSNTKELLKKMDLELNTLRTERDHYKEQVRDYTEQLFQSPRMLYFYTGLNRPTIDWILEFARRNEPQGEFIFLSVETQLLLVLVKLRLGLLYRDMAYRFKTSTKTVSRVFTLWLPILGPKLCTLKQGKGDEIHFPRYLRKSVKNCMQMLGKRRHERCQNDADSENTMSADETSVGDPTENNVVVELIDNTFEELDATNSVKKADNNNFTRKFVSDSAEVSEATKSLEQILNDSSTEGLVSDLAEESDAARSLQQIIGNTSTEELGANSPNVFYIINSAENNEGADQSKNDDPIEITDKTDSADDPANNCTEVYYIINTTDGVNNSDEAEPPLESSLPEDVIFLI